MRRLNHVTSIGLGEIEEYDARRIADRGVMTGKFESTSLSIYSKYGNVVGPLIAAIEELPRRIEVEAARIISSCPFFSKGTELTVLTNGKDPDAVVKPVAGVDKFPVG